MNLLNSSIGLFVEADQRTLTCGHRGDTRHAFKAWAAAGLLAEDGAETPTRYEGDDEDDTQQFFVGSIEERQGDLPVVSPSSPLGQVLIGRSAGDDVEYKAPGGMLKVHITAVDR